MHGARGSGSLGCLLMILGAGLATIALTTPSAAPPTANKGDELFPAVVDDHIAGRREQLKLTGTAVRKAVGIKFFRIAGYCDADLQPADVDALAAADVAKRLILVMERDVAEWVIRRSFVESLRVNDAQGRFADHAEQMLDHMTSKPLKKGHRITLTHLPQTGLEVGLGDEPPVTIADRDFAHMVWQIYMGPKGVCPKLRRGLGELLAGNDGE
jgi:hypothetical protein